VLAAAGVGEEPGLDRLSSRRGLGTLVSVPGLVATALQAVWTLPRLLREPHPGRAGIGQGRASCRHEQDAAGEDGEEPPLRQSPADPVLLPTA
jgi:hypothetical protein